MQNNKKRELQKKGVTKIITAKMEREKEKRELRIKSEITGNCHMHDSHVT
jgi:hypothetical protein